MSEKRIKKQELILSEETINEFLTGRPSLNFVLEKNINFIFEFRLFKILSYMKKLLEKINKGAIYNITAIDYYRFRVLISSDDSYSFDKESLDKTLEYHNDMSDFLDNFKNEKYPTIIESCLDLGCAAVIDIEGITRQIDYNDNNIDVFDDIKKMVKSHAKNPPNKKTIVSISDYSLVKVE